MVTLITLSLHDELRYCVEKIDVGLSDLKV